MAFMGMAVIIFGVVAETWLYLASVEDPKIGGLLSPD